MHRSVEKRIVVSTKSKKLPQTNKETNTPMYSWRVSISALDAKGKYQENLPFISHVEFKLHETFAKPRHFVHSAPFQIQERGWGSFDMFITLHFVDPTHKPYTISHDLHFRKDDYKVSRAVTFLDVSDEFYQLLQSNEADEVSPASSRHSYGSKTVRSTITQKPKPTSKGPSRTKPRSIPDSSQQRPTPLQRSSKPTSQQPTAIPKQPKSTSFQPTAIPKQPKPAPLSPPRVEKRRRAPDAIPKQLRGKSSSTSPDDAIPPSKVQRKNPVAKPKPSASSVTPPHKGVTREDIAKKLSLLKGKQIKEVVGMIKEMRSANTVIDEEEKGKFTFDIYTLDKKALLKIWTYAKACLAAPARPSS